MSATMDEPGPIWLECYEDGKRVQKPGWVQISEDNTRWNMTVMTNPEDVEFWFGQM